MISQPAPKTTVRNGIPEIEVMEVQQCAETLKLIDVRRSEEFNNELGHIKGSKLYTLGPDLEEFLQSHKNKDEYIVFICRSGARSGNATLYARELGFTNVFNMTGGMIRWNDFHLPVSRED